MSSSSATATELAYTGSDPLVGIGAGIGLVVGGVTFYIVTRKRVQR